MIFITPGSKQNPLYMEADALHDLKFMLDGMEEKLATLQGGHRDAFVLACRRWLRVGWPDVFPGVFITEVRNTPFASNPISAETRDKVINEILESLK
jgi:hypothetical protein